MISFNREAGRHARVTLGIPLSMHSMPCPHSRLTHCKAYERYRTSFFRGLDEEKENARQKRRTIFTTTDWKRHRSSTRFIRHLSTIVESGVIKGVLIHVVLVTALAAIVAAWNSASLSGLLPPYITKPPSIAIEPIQLTSFALSLLLVFRTNAAYSRWTEARQKFGSLATTARDLYRQALTWFPKKDEEAQEAQEAERLGRWLQALPIVAMASLRSTGEIRIEKILPDILLPKELEVLMQAAHKPLFCLQVVSKIIHGKAASLPTELILRMDEGVSTLVSSLSSCDRILNTPIPISYTRHTARFLLIWLFSLPFSLWAYCGFHMIWVSALISFVLLGIEEIGIYIEEPFSLLPLEALCEKNIARFRNMKEANQLIESL